MLASILNLRDTRQIIGWVGLAFTIIIFILQLPFFLANGAGFILDLAFKHIYILAWLLLITSFTRTVSLRTLVVFWFLGVYPVLALVLMVARPMTRLFGLEGPFVPGLWVPWTEEVIKALPVAIYFIITIRRNRWQLSASDGLHLGFAVGAGFTFHEDAMFHTTGTGIIRGFDAAVPWSLIWPTLTYNYTPFGPSSIVIDHAGWTALIGLAIGLASLFRGRIWAWLFPLGALTISFADHMTNNLLAGVGRSGAPFLIRSLRTLLLNGYLPLFALLGGIAFTLLVELYILYWARKRDRFFPSSLSRYQLNQVPGMTMWNALQRLLVITIYERLRRAGHFAAWGWRQTSFPPDEVGEEMEKALFWHGLAAGLRPITVNQPQTHESGATVK